ncbi:unannotated protein [freshwater metagenome]|uniref:Unannotated protein n=1 Tax=freshwater metagenome TaxID=449393 RepID=A0A6J6URE7_9ZZZZ
MREVGVSTKYIVAVSGLQPIPLEIVQPVCTGAGPVLSNRYSVEAPGLKSYAIVPAHSRPRGSHFASFMRMLVSWASTGTSNVVVASPHE